MIGPTFLALKLDKGRVPEGGGGGGNQPNGLYLPSFLTMKMTFNINKFWFGVRWYQGEFAKEYHDSTIKDNGTVTSSNLNENYGTIRILTHFLVKNHRKLQIEYKN